MFIDRKTPYCGNDSSSQLNWKIKCNSTSYPSKLLCGYQQTDPKVYEVAKEPKITDIIWKNKVGGLMQADFKTYIKLK